MLIRLSINELINIDINWLFAGGTIKATTEGNVGTLAFDWITEGSGELLMMTLPHHRQILANGIEIPEITVNVLKGNS